MRLPIFKSENRYKKGIVAFGGINYTQDFTEGEMSDCSGISHECFPMLSQRKGMVMEFECNSPSAMMFGEKECVASSGALYYDRKKVGELSDGKKSITQIGNKILIFPDKLYYDTQKGELLSMEGKCEILGTETIFATNAISVKENIYKEQSFIETNVFKEDEIVFKYTDVNIENGEIVLSGMNAVEAKSLIEGDAFSEISGNSRYRVVVSTQDAEKGEVTIVNECISVKNITENMFSHFSKGDIVEISGCIKEENNKEAKILDCSELSITFAEDTFVECTETKNIIIKRKIPDFSCICSFENRLWGCSENTIYASALGNPLNFFLYENLSTDSFTIESNSPGNFTAAASYGNYCLFFKENICYKLYGNRPANFQLVQSFSGGISADNNLSIASYIGKLFYRGNGGIYAFYGGIPQKISEKLGNLSMKNSVSGAFGNCFYISADTKDGRQEFVYDMTRNIWSKSGVKNVLGYFSYGEKFYRFLPEGVFSVSDDIDGECEWFAEFCPFNEDYYKSKNYSRLYICAQLFENSWVKVEISRDDAPWELLCIHYGNKKMNLSIPCVLKNCNEVKLRISGKGRSIIESIMREFSIN